MTNTEWIEFYDTTFTGMSSADKANFTRETQRIQGEILRERLPAHVIAQRYEEAVVALAARFRAAASDYPDPPPSLIEQIQRGSQPPTPPRPATPNIHGVDAPPDLIQRIQDDSRRTK